MGDKPFDLDAILEEAAAHKKQRLEKARAQAADGAAKTADVSPAAPPAPQPAVPPPAAPAAKRTAKPASAAPPDIVPLSPAARPDTPAAPDTAAAPRTAVLTAEPENSEPPASLAEPEAHTRVLELPRRKAPAEAEAAEAAEPLPGQVEWSSMGLADGAAPAEETEAETMRQLREEREKKVREFRLSGMEEETEPEEDIIEPDSPALDDYNSFEEAESVRSDLEYRRRTAGMSLALTAILEGVLLLLTLLSGLSGASPFEPVLAISGSLFLLILMMVVNHRLTGTGMANLLRGRADTASAAAAPCIPVLIHTVVQFFHLGSGHTGDGILAAAAGLSLLAGSAGRFIRLCRIADNFRFVSFPGEKAAVTLVADADAAGKIGRTAVAEGVPRVVYARPASFLNGFLTHAYADDALDRQMRRIVPMGLLLALFPALSYALWKGDWWLAYSAFTVTVCLLFPCAPLLSGAALLHRTARRALTAGAMIGGSEAAEHFGDIDAVAVDAEALYAPEQLLLHGIRTFKGARIDEAIMDAAAVSIAVGGPLSTVFRRIITNRVDILPAVDTPVYEQDMGVSGWVDGRRVLVGNRRLLQNHGVDVPSDAYEARYATDGRQLVYLSTAGELSAMFVLSYLPDDDLAEKCRELSRCRIDLLVRTCDPNVTEAQLCETWELDDYHVAVMDAAAARAFAALPSEPEACSAVLATDGRLPALAAALVGCHRLRRGFAVSRALQLIGALLGLTVGMALLFAADTVLPPLPVAAVGLCGTLLGWALPLLFGSR